MATAAARNLRRERLAELASLAAYLTDAELVAVLDVVRRSADTPTSLPVEHREAGHRYGYRYGAIIGQAYLQADGSLARHPQGGQVYATAEQAATLVLTHLAGDCGHPDCDTAPTRCRPTNAPKKQAGR